MSAIGAVTSVSMPQASTQRVGEPALLWMSGATTIAPSGVAGMDFTGDPIADRVIATFARDPLGFGDLGSAMDAISATMSFDPTRGASQVPVLGTAVTIDPRNALSSLPLSAAAGMAPGELIARSQSTIAAAYGGMVDSLRGGVSVHRSLSGFADRLGDGLRRDERGMNAYDHAQASIEVTKQEITRKLKERVGDPRVLIARLMSLTIAQGMIAREEEKLEELRKLIISLLIGVQVPKGCVDRLKELGLGPLVERIIQDAVGSGKSLSKGMRESIEGLADLGIDISMLQEQDTEVGLREAQSERDRAAILAGDGRLVDRTGRMVDANAVRGDLAELLRRRAAGIDTGELDGGLLATAGASGVVSGSPTDGATGVS